MVVKRGRKSKGFFSTKFGKVVILLIFFALVLPVIKVYLKSRQANQMNVGVEQELTALQDKKKFLQGEIARLKTDQGKEEEARKKLNISKPDEEMVIITDKSDASSSGSGIQDVGFFPKLWQSIKSIF
jgi:cell division protein FtsB